MKPTKSIRNAYVMSVMNDVPEIDYVQQIRDKITDISIAQLPAAVAKIYRDLATQPYVRTDWHYYYGISVTHPCADRGKVIISKKEDDELKQLQRLRDEQSNKREGLREKVYAAALSCTTRKALADLLPEFEKYLPTEADAMSKNLPAITNLMVDLVKAGWPKDGHRTAEQSKQLDEGA